jgi:hypothetical protein
MTEAKKKYEVSRQVNRMYGYQVYAIEAANEKEALADFWNGDIIREEFEDVDWNEAYGPPYTPIVEEVEEFELGYGQRLETENTKLKAKCKLMADFITDITKSLCPVQYTQGSYLPENCEEICENILESQCWEKYFNDKVEEGGGE